MVAQPASPSSRLSLPPSGRDIELYRLVKIDRFSTRQAARKLQLSQTRICQILERVGAYFGELLLQVDNDQNRRRDLLLAEQIATERMEALYRQAMQAFEQSRLQTVSVYDGDGEDNPPQITERTSGGDSRYLLTAARLSLYATKLPMPKLDDLLAACDDDEEESANPVDLREYPVDCQEYPETDFTSPPGEDCSLAEEGDVVARTEQPAAGFTEPDLDSTCVSGVSKGLMGKLTKAGPVQTPVERPQSPGEESTRPRPDRKERARRAFFGE